MNRIRKFLRIAANSKLRQELFRGRAAAGVEHGGVLRQLGRIQTVVDIGANRGQFSLMVRHCLPEAKIIAFEPLNAPAAIFRKVFVNDARTMLYEVAIGPEQGNRLMHVSAEDDSSSLLPITALQEKIFPGTGEEKSVDIYIGPLHSFINTTDIVGSALLKLDVQGYELEALKGCDGMLHCFEHVYAECSFVELYQGQALVDEVLAWMDKKGFGLAGVYNVCNDRAGRAIQGDFWFRRSE